MRINAGESSIIHEVKQETRSTQYIVINASKNRNMYNTIAGFWSQFFFRLFYCYFFSYEY